MQEHNRCTAASGLLDLVADSKAQATDALTGVQQAMLTELGIAVYLDAKDDSELYARYRQLVNRIDAITNMLVDIQDKASDSIPHNINAPHVSHAVEDAAPAYADGTVEQTVALEDVLDELADFPVVGASPASEHVEVEQLDTEAPMPLDAELACEPAPAEADTEQPAEPANLPQADAPQTFDLAPEPKPVVEEHAGVVPDMPVPQDTPSQRAATPPAPDYLLEIVPDAEFADDPLLNVQTGVLHTAINNVAAAPRVQTPEVAPVEEPPAEPAPKEASKPVPPAPAIAPTPLPDTLVCSVCGSAIRPGNKFCGFCGSPVQHPEPKPEPKPEPEVRTCPVCGEVVSPEDSFCLMCGAKLK